MKKNKYSANFYLFLLLFVVLSYFLFQQFKTYKIHQAELITRLRDLRNEEETQKNSYELFGDGRFLKTISGMSTQQSKKIINQVGEETCNTFIGFVSGKEDVSDMRNWGKGLDRGVKDFVLSDLRKIPGISGEEIWEGLKEINRLLNRVHELKEDWTSNADSQSRISSMGEQEERERQNKTEQDRKLDEDGVEDAMKDSSASLLKDTSEESVLFEQMKEVSALVLSRLPVLTRQKVLSVLKLRLGK